MQLGPWRRQVARQCRVLELMSSMASLTMWRGWMSAIGSMIPIFSNPISTGEDENLRAIAMSR